MKNTLSLLGVLVIAHVSPLYAAERNAAEADGPVRAPAHRSAFEGYRPDAEDSLADWRALNDEVAAIGGHVGIMRAPAARPAGPPGQPGAAPPARHPAAPAPGAAGHQH